MDSQRKTAFCFSTSLTGQALPASSRGVTEREALGASPSGFMSHVSEHEGPKICGAYVRSIYIPALCSGSIFTSLTSRDKKDSR